MTDENVYFQWQNPTLLKTIYPRRVVKLRHALEFYYEIDIWAEYKDKKLEELSQEIKEYHTYKKKNIQQVWSKYDNLLSNYFIINIDDPDDKDLCKQILDAIKIDKNLSWNILDKIDHDPSVKTLNAIRVDKTLPVQVLNKIKALYDPYIEQEILRKIKVVYQDYDGKENIPVYGSLPVDKRRLIKIISLHKSFQNYFNDYTDAHSESVFISSRLQELDDELKILKQDIYAQSMRLEGTRTYFLQNPVLGTEQEKDARQKVDKEKLDVLQDTLNMLQNTQRLMDAERNILSDFLIQHGKLEPRKREWEARIKKKAEIEASLGLQATLTGRKAGELKEIEGYLNRLQSPPDLGTVSGYFSSTLSVRDKIKNYLSSTPLKDTILNSLLTPESLNMEFNNYVETNIMSFHKKIPPLLVNIESGDKKVKLIMIKPVIDECVSKLRSLKESIANSWLIFKELYLMVVEMELDQLNDLQAALDHFARDEKELKQIIKDKEGEKIKIQQSFAELQKNMTGLQNEAGAYDVTEENYLQQYTPKVRTEAEWRKAIALWKVEIYKEKLSKIEDQYQLLEMIYEMFNRKPERFPLWLQYMIVHFSGMRYKSAHGSWAAPKDLYLTLRKNIVTKEVNNWPDSKIAEERLGKLEEYSSAQAERMRKVENYLVLIRSDKKDSRNAGLQGFLWEEEIYKAGKVIDNAVLLKLEDMQATLPGWVWKEIYTLTTRLRLKAMQGFVSSKDDASGKLLPEEQKEQKSAASVHYRNLLKELEGYLSAQTERKLKIEGNLVLIRSNNVHSHRSGLLGLLLDEEEYKIGTMTEDMVLENLEGMRETLPDWMWKEICALTQLRLKYAAEPKDANASTWENLSAEEQKERSSPASAVYREIMYRWKNKYFTNWRDEHWRNKKLIVSRAVCNEVAEFIQHLRGHVGGAGLASKPDWYRGEEDKYQAEYLDKSLRFPEGQDPVFLMPRQMNDYRVGASILWLRYKNDPPHDWDIAKPFTTSGGDQLVPAEYLGRKDAEDEWNYKDGGTFRSRSVMGAKKMAIPKKEYLFWLHEQTVAEVAYTAEEQVLLTFETALPYDDPRVSAIGLTKHSKSNILADSDEDAFNRFFVGFVPEQELPVRDLDDLKEMLNWNHILRKPDFMTEEKLQEYQEKHIRIKAPVPIPAQSMSSDGKITFTVTPPPDSTQGSKFYVKIWSEEMGKLAGRDTNLKPPFENGEPFSNFQAIPLFTEKYPFEAIMQYIELDQEAMEYLKSLQLRDDKKIARLNPKEGGNKKSKFNMEMDWLVRWGKGRPYWTEDGEWSDSKWSVFRFGTIVFGGQMVQVEVNERDEPVVYKFKARYPSEDKDASGEFLDTYKVGFNENDKRKDYIEFYKLVGLRKKDMYRVTHQTHPWLIQQCTAVNGNNNYNKTPRGLTIYHPVWDPQDWKLSSGGTSLYIARHFLQDIDPSIEYDQRRQRDRENRREG